MPLFSRRILNNIILKFILLCIIWINLCWPGTNKDTTLNANRPNTEEPPTEALLYAYAAGLDVIEYRTSVKVPHENGITDSSILTDVSNGNRPKQSKRSGQKRISLATSK
jgi:hypothetical protein